MNEREMTSQELSDQVRAAMLENGVTGMIALSDRTGLSRPKTSNVWHGVKTAKIGDFITTMHNLGYDLEFVKRGA